jgi:hypothetical protein
VLQGIARDDVLDLIDGTPHRFAPQVVGLGLLFVHVADDGFVAERARIRASHAGDEPLHRHVPQKPVFVIELAIGHGEIVERHRGTNIVLVDGPVACLDMEVTDLGDVRAGLHRLDQLQHGVLAFAAADDVDAGLMDHFRRVRRVGAADDDRNVPRLFDFEGEPLNRVMHPSEGGERDETRIVFFDRAEEIRCVRYEQQVGLVPVRLENAGEIGNANRFLDAVVLDEQDFHDRSKVSQTATKSRRLRAFLITIRLSFRL